MSGVYPKNVELVDPPPPEGSGLYVTWKEGSSKVKTRLGYDKGGLKGITNVGVWKEEGFGSGWKGGGGGETLDDLTCFRTYVNERANTEVLGFKVPVPGKGR